MAAVPVRKALLPITDRKTAFTAVSRLYQEYIDIDNVIKAGALDNAGIAQSEQLLTDILRDLQVQARELMKYPAPVYQASIKSVPSLKSKPSVAYQAAKIEADQFKSNELSVANNFLELLRNSRRVLPDVVATFQRQVQDFKEEHARLEKIVEYEQSPVKYLTLLAQSRLPKSNWLTIGSTKFYMKENLTEKDTEIPVFKKIFFKDLNLARTEDQIKLDQAKAIFTKVFKEPEGTPLDVCAPHEVDLLKEGLMNYLEFLREDLMKLQSEKGPNAYPTRAALSKAESIKRLIDDLWKRQEDICKKGTPKEEPEPEIGTLNNDELQRLLRKFVLLLAAKQKQVPGFEKHTLLADKLIKLLSPVEVANVQNANFPGIERDLGDVIGQSRLFKMLYLLGKGGADKVIENIQRTFALTSLRKLRDLIQGATFISEDTKASLVEGINFDEFSAAPTNLELLQKRLVEGLDDETNNWNLLRNELQEKVRECEDLQALRDQVRDLTAEVARLRAAGGAPDPALLDRIRELEAAKTLLEQQLQQAEREVIRLSDELTAEKARTADFQRRLDDLLLQKDAVDRLLDAARADIAAKALEISTKDATIADLTTRLSDATGELTTLRTAVADKEAELVALRAAKAKCDSDLAAKILEVQDLNARLRDYDPNLRAQYNALLAEKNALAAEKQRVDDELARNNVELARVTSELAALKADKAKVDGDLATEKAARTKAEGDLATEKAARTKAEGDLAAEKAARARLDSEKTALQAANAQLQADLDSLRASSEALAREARRLQEIVDRLDPEAKECARKLTIANAEVARLTALSQKLNSDLVACEAEKQRLQAALTALQRQYEDLQTRLQTASVVIKDAQQPGDINPGAPPAEPGEGPIRTILQRVQALLSRQPPVPGPVPVPEPIPVVPGPRPVPVPEPRPVIPGPPPVVPRQEGGKCPKPLTRVNPQKGSDFVVIDIADIATLRGYPYCLDVEASNYFYSKSDLESKATNNLLLALQAGLQSIPKTRKVQVSPEQKVTYMRGGNTRKLKKTSQRKTRKNKHSKE